MFGSKKIKKFMETYNIPQGATLVNYFGGCFGNRQCLVFLRVNATEIHLCEYNLKSKPFFACISKDNLIAFTQIGEYSSNSIVSGGGVSLGGAAVGAVLFGPVGAVVGGRKKVKTQVQATDTRKTVIKYRADGSEKSFVLSGSAYDMLCCNFIEKKI